MVDSYRFLDGISKKVIRHWCGLEAARSRPWTPLAKRLPDCTVALVSSAALALRSDSPFQTEIEQLDPWFSDPSYRILPSDARTADTGIHHLHINTEYAARDLDCVMPLARLAEMASAKEIGGSASSHYSYSGYTLRPQRLLKESAPSMVEQMRREGVDVVVLVPV
ncbi:MAG: hypothetical protein K2X35_19945 [Bryobacteraceae bacterium]|nr:hypothetical protein [Bryobacteraceae bacterium]